MDRNCSRGIGSIRAGQEVKGGQELVRRRRMGVNQEEYRGRIGAGQEVQRG
jgi:hypothetical protein